VDNNEEGMVAENYTTNAALSTALSAPRQSPAFNLLIDKRVTAVMRELRVPAWNRMASQ
jgi:hypothetical protein